MNHYLTKTGPSANSSIQHPIRTENNSFVKDRKQRFVIGADRMTERWTETSQAASQIYE
jgi:hypothetical protein